MPYFSRTDTPWRNQKPIINQLPAYSLFIFAGILDWQLVYIRRIATAVENHRRWDSLHPVIISEKGDATGGRFIADITPTNDVDFHNHRNNNSTTVSSLASIDPIATLSTKSSFLFNKWTFWVHILAITRHLIAILVFVTIKLVVINDPETDAFISAICLSIMTFPSLLNAIAIMYTGRCHSKLVSGFLGQNRQDVAILFLLPILFALIMSSTTTITWMAYARPNPLIRPLDNNLVSWILVKAFSVYFPLSILLICRLFKRNQHQNPIEDNISHSRKGSKRRPSINSTLLKDRSLPFGRINNKRIFEF